MSPLYLVCLVSSLVLVSAQYPGIYTQPYPYANQYPYQGGYTGGVPDFGGQVYPAGWPYQPAAYPQYQQQPAFTSYPQGQPQMYPADGNFGGLPYHSNYHVIPQHGSFYPNQVQGQPKFIPTPYGNVPVEIIDIDPAEASLYLNTPNSNGPIPVGPRKSLAEENTNGGSGETQVVAKVNKVSSPLLKPKPTQTVVNRQFGPKGEIHVEVLKPNDTENEVKPETETNKPGFTLFG